MKKLIITAGLSLVTILSVAQKTKVQDASNAFRQERWEEAKNAIDEAAQNETSKGMHKMWYLRGKIYQTICEQNSVKHLCDANSMTTAVESFKRALEIDPKGEFADEIKSYWMANIPIKFFERGFAEFQAKNYDLALAQWEQALKYAPDDTGQIAQAVIANSALAAEKKGDQAKARSFYQLMIKNKIADDNTFLALANSFSREGKYNEALEAVVSGRKIFPDSLQLMLTHINVLFGLNKNDEANQILKAAIEKDPSNANLYAALGSTYDGMANPRDNDGKPLEKPKNYDDLVSKAAEAYKKGISIDPNNVDMNYNLGVLYFNDAAEISNAANKLTDNKAYEKEKARFESKFKEALPYLEAAKSLNPQKTESDMSYYRNTLQSLKSIYAKLQLTEKYNAVKAELESKK
ncbi:MAG: hypothetical protein RIQ89_810 [Bacteroidota bacterium]